MNEKTIDYRELVNRFPDCKTPAYVIDSCDNEPFIDAETGEKIEEFNMRMMWLNEQIDNIKTGDIIQIDGNDFVIGTATKMDNGNVLLDMIPVLGEK